MNYTNPKLVERYQNDVVFHTIVDAIYAMIASHGITPSELREALFFAHYKYEMENPNTIRDSIIIRMQEIYHPNYDRKKNEP